MPGPANDPGPVPAGSALLSSAPELAVWRQGAPAPEYRHQGIGRRLTQALIDYCPGVGIKTLVALIFGHNEPSLRLCEQLGFERWGFLPGIAELDGVSRDLVILGKKL